MREKINILSAFVLLFLTEYIFSGIGGKGDIQYGIVATTAIAIGAGLKAAYGYGKGRGWWGAQPVKPPQRKLSEQELRYEKELNRRIEEGTLSPEAARLIKNRALQTAYGAAETGAGRIQQNLSRRGFEGSAIGAEATAGVYDTAVNKAGEVGKEVALTNELSKTQAFDKLGAYGEKRSSQMYQDAMLKYGYQKEKQQFKNQAYDQSFNTAVDAGVGYFGGTNPSQIANQGAFSNLAGMDYGDFMKKSTSEQLAIIENMSEDDRNNFLVLSRSMGN